MVYRLLIDTINAKRDLETGQWRDEPSGTNLRGVFTAGLSEGLGDIPYPHITNERARFYFTEAGWQTYGRHVYAAAVRRGHQIRLIRRKNPAKSQIVYQDTYQMALLPEKRREKCPKR
jgi:hypothetical protein